MLLSISEGVLLEKAVAAGLISAVDVAAARADQTTLTVPRRWGLLLDRLISQGKLTDEQVRRLHEDLASGQPGSPALDRTMDGGLERTMDGGPSRSDGEPIVSMDQALDRTMASQPGSPQPPSSSPGSSPSFPAPHWDKYEFLELLGRGGMGSVYRARDRRLGRLVALKFIHGDDPGLIQRFLQEARSQARLDHPFICKVFEVGSVDSKPYIAMELVDGRTLDRISPQLSLSDKLQVVKDTAEALHHAHEQGIIHRDIKPSTDVSLGRVRKDFPFPKKYAWEVGPGRVERVSLRTSDQNPHAVSETEAISCTDRASPGSAARTVPQTARLYPGAVRGTPAAHRESQFP